MKKLQVHGIQVEYDETKQYRSIGVVGSTHGGEVFDSYHVSPEHGLHFPKNIEIMVLEMEGELYKISQLLKNGSFPGDNGVIQPKAGEIEQYKNTQELYLRILAKVKDKSLRIGQGIERFFGQYKQS